ncbi:MAG: S1C family serine protease [Candidatus Dormibacteria bacterium]
MEIKTGDPARRENTTVATLKDISDGIAGAVALTSPSVARVDARRGSAASGTVWADGLVLTADHVLHDSGAIRVSFGADESAAEVVGRDARTDLALLKLEGAHVPLIRSDGALRIGQLVLAIGRPREVEATFGVVNALAPGWHGWGGQALGKMIHTDAPLNRGFSGGPLVDADGHLLGFNSWYYGRGNTRALDLATLERLVRSLVDHGRVRRAYLGIGGQPVYLSEGARELAHQDSGLMLISVEAGSAAAEAGLLQGDTLVSIGEYPVRGLRELASALGSLEVGAPVTVSVVRAGGLTTVEVTTGERSAPEVEESA